MTLDALARDSGTFVMVAMDQRESLRTMLAQHHNEVGRERIAAFKQGVARELSPHASGFLIDAEHVAAVRPHVPPSCGLIVAADVLEQPRGGIVEETGLDEHVDLAAAAAVALKLLVIWRDDERRAERVSMSRRFVELAAECGVLSVLEGVVRVPDHVDRDAAVVEAAAELAGVGPSLYKCEVPMRGRGDAVEIEQRSRGIDAVVRCPWVVLSQGVDPDDFPAAVEAACRGGASGMLAGRAVWTATLAGDDPTELLRTHSVPRLHELARIVDAHARPWREKLKC